jgi:RNA polymerase sigma-70 factor (ECF subfamily)
MEQSEINPAIMVEFKKGDASAFTTFFQMHYQPLCRFASQVTGSLPDAEDIVKDVYVKLWQKHMDFDTPQNIKAFLFISTRNACLNFLRHLQVKEASRKELLYLESWKSQEVVVNLMVKEELMQQIFAEIENLPKRRRTVFKMAYLEGMKNNEIATHMDIAYQTVKEHKCKALQSLRRRFSNLPF